MNNNFQNIRAILRFLTPYGIVGLLKSQRAQIKFDFKYSSWSEVVANSSGYSEMNILNTVEKSVSDMLLLERGWERDGVLFPEVRLNHAILSSLLMAVNTDRSLGVYDFGGALGSTYFQNKDILQANNIQTKWTIIEQENFVAAGKKLLYKFDECNFTSLQDLKLGHHADILLFGSVLCYLPNPYWMLNKLVHLLNFPKYISIDRTLFDDSGEHTYGIQAVHSEIYEARLPIFLLSRKQTERALSPWYELVFEWNDPDQLDQRIQVKGMTFRKR